MVMVDCCIYCFRQKDLSPFEWCAYPAWRHGFNMNGQLSGGVWGPLVMVVMFTML